MLEENTDIIKRIKELNYWKRKHFSAEERKKRGLERER